MSNQLDHAGIREILNLRGGPLIAENIAARQLEVIRKGFNFLSDPANNALYIADEVGLGKTYVALGVAALMRHFSNDPACYQDVIIVPKENLQYKWEKEIKQFIKNNYLLHDNRVKSVIGQPIGEISTKEDVVPLVNDHPGYHIYRNSQFSLGMTKSNETKKELFLKMLGRLSNPTARSILQKAYDDKYFLIEYRSGLKKLYAYLLSLCNPAIELLIVDEGHNYKHGLGITDDDQVADRNQVIARFLGIKKNSEEDREIFEWYPELKTLLQPKVQKLIVLSATPKTYSLLELCRQLDCFLPRHILSGVTKEDEVRERLHRFLIRGNMEYVTTENQYTRNLCRNEYRKGGVHKIVPESELTLEDNEQAVILGLLQYKTIKHLGSKHNASFELGMLAGFETFRLDQTKRAEKVQEKLTENSEEYEEVRLRKTRTSQDYVILEQLIDSYRQNFDGNLPPHPKQDALVTAVFKMMREGEKALIFVRRVASAAELEKRLLGKWEETVFDELTQKWSKKLKSDDLTELLATYRRRKTNLKLEQHLDRIIQAVVDRLLTNKDLYPAKVLEEAAQYKVSEYKVVQTGLLYVYNQYASIQGGEDFFEQMARHCDLSIIKTVFVEQASALLTATRERWLPLLKEEQAEEEVDTGSDTYFFHSYFRQPHTRAFRKKIVQVDWFDVNYYLLNHHYHITGYDKEVVRANAVVTTNTGLKEIQEAFIKAIQETDFHKHLLDDSVCPSIFFKDSLITRLMMAHCQEEFSIFLINLAGRRKTALFHEIRVLSTIIRGCLRNGSGFLPLFIADKAPGDVIENFLQLITDEQSVFHLVLTEIRTIIREYHIIRAVNFPESDTFRQIDTKLYFQTPVLGITGQSKRDKSHVATQFRMPGFPYVLVTTDIFREGEDLHTYCQNIYHYGIAWNCSDMEQRTGRIDRINSISHRKLMSSQALDHHSQLHVFFPYLKNTLEVNQIVRLFSGLNDFIYTFNDFTSSYVENSVAHTRDAVEAVPEVLRLPLRSKFDVDRFLGYEENGQNLYKLEAIGWTREQLLLFLQEIQLRLINQYAFHYGPLLDTELFMLNGDVSLPMRQNRRAPFRLVIRNAASPGEFILEAGAYLFKKSSKVHRVLKSREENFSEYELGAIEDYYALVFTAPLTDFQVEPFVEKLIRLLQDADDLEEELSTDDVNMFT
jgi:hypothetical protein